jgi:basic membrane protein A and related proteins
MFLRSRFHSILQLVRIVRRRMFLRFSLSFLLVIALSVSCTPNNAPQTEAEAPPKTSNFKVAMVLPATINDGSWSQAGYEGLQLIEKELGAQIAYTENAGELSDPEKEKVFEKYAKDGFDFVIGHGGEFLAGVEAVAIEYPRIKFSATTNCAGNNINQGCLSIRSGELGYLTGVIAAMKTKTNKVAFLGGVDYAHMKERAMLFERGAKSINPKIEVQIDWLGNWTDKEKIKTIAQKQLESGVDVISISAEPAEESVFPLAQEKGFWMIGWDRDRSNLAPDRVITSAIQNIPQLMLKGAILAQTGRWQGKQYKLGIEDGVQELAPFRGLLTPEQEAKIKAITEDILTDKIDVSS